MRADLKAVKTDFRSVMISGWRARSFSVLDQNSEYGAERADLRAVSVGVRGGTSLFVGLAPLSD